uniref:Pleiotropic drug resistance protein 3 n=1 Tax=Rhizophora mucronata TaxID=61149 RepID=A0A2P2IH28_RHIMU
MGSQSGPVQKHRAKLSTFQRPSLYKRQFFPQLPLAAQLLHFAPRGTEQQRTLNPLH